MRAWRYYGAVEFYEDNCYQFLSKGGGKTGLNAVCMYMYVCMYLWQASMRYVCMYVHLFKFVCKHAHYFCMCTHMSFMRMIAMGPLQEWLQWRCQCCACMYIYACIYIHIYEYIHIYTCQLVTGAHLTDRHIIIAHMLARGTYTAQ